MSMNGIDIASYQAGINLAAVPCDFVIIKATEGTGYVNPDCDRAYQQAKALGKCRGVYHYANGGSVQAEAEYFLNNVQGYVGEAILCLDWEAGNNPSFGVNDFAWCKSWLDYVAGKTGINPLLYISQSVIGRFAGIGDYGLWVAQYADMCETGYQDKPWNEGAYDCAIRQYSSCGRLSGYGGNLDLDKFYGDKNVWNAYAGTKKSESTKLHVSAAVGLQANTGADAQRWALESVNGYYRLRNKKTGFMLDLKGACPDNNTELQVYKKNGTDAQLFTIKKVHHGLADYVEFEPKLSPGKLMSCEWNGIGSNRIKIYEDLHNSKQKFYLRQESDGYYLIIHAFTGKCVSVVG